MAPSTPTTTTVAAVVPTPGRTRLVPLSATGVSTTGGFWAEHAANNRERTIPAGYRQLQAVGTLDNFQLAATHAKSGYQALGVMFDGPFPFLDSDVYKWLEAAGWELGRAPDPTIRRWPTRPSSWSRPPSDLTATSTRSSRSLGRDALVGPPLGPRALLHRPSHPGRRGLAPRARRRPAPPRRRAAVAASTRNSARTAGRRSTAIPRSRWRWSSCSGSRASAATWRSARHLVERRGHGLLGAGRFGAGYWQDQRAGPRRATVVGHAVRQLYLDCGAVDVAVETGDRAARGVVRRWRDMVRRART